MRGTRRCVVTVPAVVVSTLFLFGVGVAAAHTVSSSAVAFYNPSNWPYYECATGRAELAHTRDGKSFVHAYHHTPTCSQPNSRPTGWLRAGFDMWVHNGASWQLCYLGSYAYSGTWGSSFAVGGVECGAWAGTQRTYYSVGFQGYWDDFNGTWRSGLQASPTHVFS